MTDIAQLLADSRNQHTLYRMADREKDLAGSTTAFQKAARFRGEAHALDPQHTDPAWAEEPDVFAGQSDALLTFYAQQIAR